MSKADSGGPKGAPALSPVGDMGFDESIEATQVMVSMPEPVVPPAPAEPAIPDNPLLWEEADHTDGHLGKDTAPPSTAGKWALGGLGLLLILGLGCGGISLLGALAWAWKAGMLG